jgi:hypothetical protein
MTIANPNTGERIATLEVEVRYLTEKVKLQTEGIVEIHKKLDELLELKSMGKGAAWLLGIVASSGILGIIYYVSAWMKGDVG